VEERSQRSSIGQRLARRLLPAGSALVLLVLTSGCTLLSFDKRSSYKFDHPSPIEDLSFRRSLDGFGNPMVGGNRAEILNNGDEIFAGMLGAIREAKETVDLESYIFKNDKAGEIFAADLMAAAKRGVEVRVLVDATGSSRTGPLLAKMRKAGVKAEVFHPIRLWSIYKIGRRSHRKILVVDGKVSFTGGFCIAEAWMGNARNSEEWRDMMVRATGPVSAQMQAIFAEDWTYTTGEILAGDKFYPSIAPEGGIMAQGVKMSRGDSSSLAEMLFLVAIESARKSIHIQNAYFVPDAQIRAALIAAAKRGVDVRIMVPGKHIDMPLLRMASRLHYGELLIGGVRIFEYHHTMMHNKDAVFDGIFSTIGSINFDARSLLENAEDSLSFYDREFAARLDTVFAEDEKACREVTYESWKKRGAEQRLAETFSVLFQPLY
jgi:cardiolipin synthase